MDKSNNRNITKTEKKGSVKWVILAVLAAGIIFFFFYYRVTEINVQESSHYSKEEIQDMVLRGPFAWNSVLAPVFCTKKVDNIPFIEGYEVDQLDRNSILVSVKETQPVGCIKYLDCYVYFDNTGRILNTSTELDKKVAYFDGLHLDSISLDETLDIKETILNTAVSLSRIFEKNDMIPDHIIFNSNNNIYLQYGDITVDMGKDTFLEDKMARMIAIMPKLKGKKGILHLGSVTGTVKTITFEEEKEPEPEEDTEIIYDEEGNPIEVPKEEESWEDEGWYDEEGWWHPSDESYDDYINGYGYDEYNNYNGNGYETDNYVNDNYVNDYYVNDYYGNSYYDNDSYVSDLYGTDVYENSYYSNDYNDVGSYDYDYGYDYGM